MKKQQRLAATSMIRQQAQKRHTVRRRYALNLNIIWRAGILSILATEKLLKRRQPLVLNHTTGMAQF
ncbi:MULTISPECIES: hypothetical protein [Paenibacillus]|uniref:hypothetical protein n=1 Tax=Paenibacillus TaxID=44249 RepID=UPI000A3FE169|nr:MULTISPECIES: hypothetical protein [Paenibacillus]MEE4569782.1 hypothetical protein [Paenibacillus polymyxa]